MNKTRILLSQKDQLRKFCFIVPYKDGSLTFGSSLPKPKEMKIGKIEIPSGQQCGETRVNYDDADNIEPAISHFTYHPPRKDDLAIVHLRTDDGNRLFEYSVDKLDDMEEFKRIFTLIPRDLRKYSLFHKKVASNDIVIPIDIFEDRPFCVEVFLCRKFYDYKNLLIKDASLITLGICENRDYRLIIELYHKKEFSEWSKFDVMIPFVKGIS